jgi:hypothetical protein
VKPGQAKSIANGKCCFCGLDVAIAEDVHTKRQVVLHELPMCDEYEKTDADEFTKRIDFKPVDGN